MSKYSEYIKSAKEKDRAFFFGDDIKKTSNKYFKFSHVKDDDNFILVTNDIKTIKGSYVLIVGSNKAVYLKDWQVRPVHNYDLGINSYAVKLNRKYFKVYTFRNDFEGYEGADDESFDSLLETSKAQDSEGMAIAEGHTN